MANQPARTPLLPSAPQRLTSRPILGGLHHDYKLAARPALRPGSRWG
jgi:hypothetical protein